MKKVDERQFKKAQAITTMLLTTGLVGLEDAVFVTTQVYELLMDFKKEKV